MINDHKFKFIIPVYNNPKYLEFCLNSIEKQDYNKDLIDVIVIDDNSDDKLILTEYSFKLQIINNKERMYPAYNRYIGYSKALDNELVVFLDGDDWLTDETILSLINKIYLENKIDWSISNHKLFSNGRIKIKPCFVSKNIRNSRPKICHLRVGYGYVWNKMPESWIKKDNNIIKWMTDWNENIWALNNYGEPYKINCSLSVYNMDTSKTRRENKDYFEMEKYFKNKIL